METRHLGEFLRWAKTQIDSLDAELIAVNMFATGQTDRSWLVSHDQMILTAARRRKGMEMVKKRAKGEPLAYVLGKKEFYGREFEVNSDVLIPRVETETLIDLIKELDLPKRPVFLEIGTGSGCIAVTLALEYPQGEVLATDISLNALAVADRNNQVYEGRAMFAKSDLLDAIDFQQDGQFDVVVANLPYVDPKWDWLDLKSLEFEPATALYAMTENGLSLYYRLFEDLSARRFESGVKYSVVEADPCQHEALTKFAEKLGWKLQKKQGYGLVFRDDVIELH